MILRLPHSIQLVCALLTAAAPALKAEENLAFSSDILPLVEQYCTGCHGSKRAKGGINLEQFRELTSLYRDPRLWETVFTQLNEREMPPDGKPQPTPEERDRLTRFIRRTLDNLDHGAIPKDPGRVLIHRLSRLEYNNTVRDLFGVSIRPADRFPADGGGGGGFDNIADTLFVPPILMERFLAAADEILDAAPVDRIFISRPDRADSEPASASAIFEHFVPRAYRRPAQPGEVDSLMSLYESGRRNGLSFEQGVKLGLRAVLISPKFLFRIEEDQPVEGPYPISAYELASRLSYFLWSSMPDDELFKLAASGNLTDPQALRAQVRRMVSDSKGATLASTFARQWLRVDELNSSAKPDPGRYPGFTTELRDSMMQEPVALFRSLLVEDSSLLDLIDSDYTFVDETLASHYAIPGVTGPEFRRVAFSNKNRGGVLGMGAVLTLTSYPRRTSPVLRGKWLLEQLLGTTPPPPPPSVKSLPGDDKPRDGLTLRQQLEKHRADPACASCHKKMDPLGLGLENFDGIGQWRSEIAGSPVDASGLLASGEAFEGPAELRSLLLNQKDVFVRNLTEKMLSYALGRGLDYYDAPVVKRISKTIAAHGYRSSALIDGIVESFPFQYRRNQPATRVEEQKNEP